jgi:3'5'-cyclic nucleotide phosphodiesterase
VITCSALCECCVAFVDKLSLTRLFSKTYRYRDNPFHCFEHASHVTMSVVKLLSRIVAPTDVLQEFVEHVPPPGQEQDAALLRRKLASTLHDHTYGITSDPLTQFAVVFSALIHDVDHQGVPNTTLVNEQSPIALLYHNKSVAEQNSLDLAWEVLMSDEFVDLRKVIFTTPDEQARFRQLVVNTVLATDIMDANLKALRNARWDRAFSPLPSEEVIDVEAKSQDAVNRKATIVIEHLIQASDVAHTMQHWHVYRRWNARLYQELCLAYKKGRLAKHPKDFWFEGEKGFFDNYIIPLAHKLRDCGVFGVSSFEYLDYAMENRRRWEEHGQELLAEWIEIEKTREG